MRTALIAGLLCFGFGAAEAAPRLFVIVVVDQMRPDYLDNSSGRYTKGMARLNREARIYDQARHDHLPTETAVGHAGISTGRFPYAHGIVGNGFYDVVLGTYTNNVTDTVFGKGPEKLRVYTVGDALKARDPESKVATVSGKDRSAIMLGGKKNDLALWYDRENGGFMTSPYYGERPKWLDGLKPRGGPSPKEVLSTPMLDRVTLEAALEMARRLKLGRDDHPDILGISFTATDVIGHKHGQEGPEMRANLANLDAVLGDLLEGLEKIAGKGQVALALSADHGAHPAPSKAKYLKYGKLAEEMEKALQYDFPSKRPWIVSDDVFPHIFLNRAQSAQTGLDWSAFRRQAAKRLETVEGVLKVYLTDELDESDERQRLIKRSLAPGRHGDLFAIQHDNVLFIDSTEVNTHGSINDYDQHVPLLFWGQGFAAGRSSERVRVIDLAPTAAASLGFEFLPEKEGKVLR